MAIAWFPGLVMDCPDAGTLARFYGALLDWNVTVDDDGSWAEARSDDGMQCLSFQQVEDFRAPEWPDQARPQQMHLDVMVEDFESAEPAVLELGATKHSFQPGTTFRVFLDPAGHPFCLCLS
jgi:hypothetical protein